jgi:hypothetical protein
MDVRNRSGLWFHPGRAVERFRINESCQIEFGNFQPQGQAFFYEDGDEGCLLLVFAGDGRKGIHAQKLHLFRRIGEGIYRAQNDCQMVVFNEGSPWKTIAGNAFGTDTQLLRRAIAGDAFGTDTQVPGKDFVGELSLLWAHPGQPSKIVTLGHDTDSVPKVVYRYKPYHGGTEPHGVWSFRGAATNFPSSVEPGSSTILAVTFHHQGKEALQQQTFFGLVRGTKNVFIAIGTDVEKAGPRFYQDSEISAMKDYHILAIILGGAEEALRFQHLFPETQDAGFL